MTYFADLSPCTYFGPSAGRLIAIGWLDRDHPRATGSVTSAWFRSLALLAQDPWQPGTYAGSHRCELCVHTGGPSSIQFEDITIRVGVANLFIPADDGVYVAPSLALHYIDAHGYVPPDAFQRAVEDCPPMRSMDYYRGLVRHGVRAGGSGNARQD